MRGLLQPGNKDILLNLGAINYVYSFGIGALARFFTMASNQDGQMKILNLNKKLQKLFAITKLLMVFDSYEDEQKASGVVFWVKRPLPGSP